MPWDRNDYKTMIFIILIIILATIIAYFVTTTYNAQNYGSLPFRNQLSAISSSLARF